MTFPKVFHQILRRERLIEILNVAADSEAVCFVAPYGFGKTLGVLSWLKEYDQKAAWLTLTAEDSTAQPFAGKLAAALLPFAKTPECTDFFASEPTDPHEFLSRTARFAADGGWRCDALVIDDFHHMKDPALLRELKELMRTLLTRVRTILLSRAELPPAFNDLVLKRNVCLVTIRELSFSRKEIAAYFQMNGVGVPEENLQTIYDATEGWPVALNVVMAVSREGPVEYGQSARAYVQGFFETEIWSGLDESVKDFLVRTSVLDELSPPLCYALTGAGEALTILHALFTGGLFISRQERDTYRYHRVFHDFIKGKLETSPIDEKELYKKAAWWYYEKEEYGKSFEYFYKAHDLYGLNQVLKIINPVNVGGIEQFLKLTSGITSLDISELKPFPVIIARIALIHFVMGDIAKMHALYPVFNEWSEPGEMPVTPEEYEEFLFELGWLAYLDPLENAEENQKHRSWISTISGATHLQKLMVDRTSVLYLPSMIRGVRDFGDDAIFPTEGILRRVEAGEKGLIDLQESVWLTYLLLAEYYYEQERFQEAEQIVRRVMARIEQHKSTFIYFIGTALLVKLIRAQHDSREIDNLTMRLKLLIIGNGDHFLLPNFHAFELRNRLAEGIPGFTDVFLKENAEYENKPYFYLIYRHFTFVRALLSTGEYNRALILLGNLKLLCEKYKRPTDLLEISILSAVALFALGDEEAARQLLLDALLYAKRYNYIRTFADDVKELWPILEIIRRQTNDVFIKTVVISCKKSLARSGAKPQKRRDELTKTELKILKSLQTGMSYEEIAQDHNVRVSTVKSHAHSIYSKLHVDNRVSAVMAARKAGILK